MPVFLHQAYFDGALASEMSLRGAVLFQMSAVATCPCDVSRRTALERVAELIKYQPDLDKE